MIQEPLASMQRLRWTAFTLVASAYVLSFFHRVAPAAIAVELQSTFQASGTALGALAATYFYVYTVMQIPTGVLADTLGPRRIVTLGGIIAGAGSIVFGVADDLHTAAVGRILVGLGVSVTFISLLKLNAAWFHAREFATLTGLSMLMGNIGAVAAAGPLAWLVTVTSWRNVFVAVGLISTTLGMLSFFMVRDHPDEVRLGSSREPPLSSVSSLYRDRWTEALLRVITNPRSWPGICVGMGILGSFYTFVGLWAVPYFIHVHDMARNLAAKHTTIMLLAFAIGSLVCGLLSDRIGRRRPVLIGFATTFTLSWLPWFSGAQLPFAFTYLFCMLMGFSAAGGMLVMASAKELNPPAVSGMATSVANTGVFLGVGILQPLVGWMLDAGWLESKVRSIGEYTLHDFRLGLAVMLAFSVVGLLSACAVTETFCRNVASQGVTNHVT